VLPVLLLLPLLAPLLAVLLGSRAIQPPRTTSSAVDLELAGLPLGAWIGLAGAGVQPSVPASPPWPVEQGPIPAPANPRQEPARRNGEAAVHDEDPESPKRREPAAASRSRRRPGLAPNRTPRSLSHRSRSFGCNSAGPATCWASGAARPPPWTPERAGTLLGGDCETPKVGAGSLSRSVPVSDSASPPPRLNRSQRQRGSKAKRPLRRQAYFAGVHPPALLPALTKEIQSPMEVRMWS